MSLGSIPVFELPGFELPRRQRLHAPLHPSIRRPVAETRPFLDFGLDHAPHDPATALARRLADHIDESRLVGHGSLLAKLGQQSARNTLTTSFEKALGLRQGRSYLSFGAFSLREPVSAPDRVGGRLRSKTR